MRRSVRDPMIPSVSSVVKCLATKAQPFHERIVGTRYAG